MTKPRPDLYWQWAEATGFGAYGSAGDRLLVHLLVECVSGKTPRDLHLWLQSGRRRGFVPQLYQNLVDTRYCAAWVEKEHIASLPGNLVSRFQLGVPRRALRDWLIDDWQEASPWPAWKPTGPLESGMPLLAIIDDEIAYKAPCFQDATGISRFALFWDQNTNGGYGPVAPRLGYTLGQISRGVQLATQPRASHGTHVASLAGGNETPAWRLRYSARVNAPALNDAASGAALAGIVLPKESVRDTSGGALAVNVFDAMSFLAASAPTSPIVVNLSFGTMGGPHNETSIFAAALQDLIARQEANGGSLTLVMPAGNSFEMQCHASVQLAAQEERTWIWRVLPDDHTPNFAEVWLPVGTRAKVTLKAPDGSTVLASTVAGSPLAWPPAAPTRACLMRHAAPSNGDGELVLIAISPSRIRQALGLAAAPPGDWTLAVKNEGAEAHAVRIWLERDNATYGRKAQGRQSYLVEPQWPRRPPGIGDSATATPAATTGFGSLNGSAGFNEAVVVGAYQIASGQVARYSAAGSLDSQVRCPDGLAPGDESSVRPGLPGAAHTGSGTVRIGGTSVATPITSRIIFNLLANQFVIRRPPPAPPTTANGYDAREGIGRIVL